MNIIWLIILILLGFFFFGSSGTTVESSPPAMAATVEINGNPGVILDATAYHPDAEGWTPDLPALQAAEDAVLAAPAGDRTPQVDGFRQYVGIIDEGDRKVVVNSLCVEFDGWTEAYIEVMDGGSCFWHALYNVETGELEFLIVNGEA
jgi:hypothetical protein